MEAVVAGVPMVTWPLFGEQFYNGSFVKRLRIGISIGSMDTGLIWGEEEDAGALVKRGRVAAAVARLMGGGGVVREIRERASRLSELARAAVRKGGSSYVNLDRLIEDLSNHKRVRMSNIGER
ncbi:unnamed protein product [Thlaspi arvense]|uniref:Uncharacterized protein n=1 Tax=Thlaspi arvense TaxID=13288 RepID=A0AAU9RLU8_THLAR|nr:unnamed protein product [Thlaspi arvense]